MKRLLLLLLAAIPLFGFSVNFIFCDYDYYEDEYWYDEYWDDYYWYDGYWVYYPHGYYCVHYVWWYPWWWDYYWWRAHWCHHFHWDFFYGGFYVVWYENGCWWFRPRYGRWVKYKLPYSYYEIRHRARKHGIYLPEKPPRELNIPYKEHEIKKLIKQKDPELFKKVEKKHKDGTLEKMRKEYDTRVKQEIAKKNIEYKKTVKKGNSTKGFEKKGYDVNKWQKSSEDKHTKDLYYKSSYDDDERKSHIVKEKKSKPTLRKKGSSDEHDDQEYYKKKKPKKFVYESYEEKRSHKSDGDAGPSKIPIIIKRRGKPCYSRLYLHYSLYTMVRRTSRYGLIGTNPFIRRVKI